MKLYCSNCKKRIEKIDIKTNFETGIMTTTCPKCKHSWNYRFDKEKFNVIKVGE